MAFNAYNAWIQIAGVDVISVDVRDWSALCTADAGKRKAAVDKNAATFKEMGRGRLGGGQRSSPHRTPKL